jgi:hypothetical protein
MYIKNNVDLEKFRKKVADSFLFTVNIFDFYERKLESEDVSLTITEFVRKVNTDDQFAENILSKCVAVI